MFFSLQKMDKNRDGVVTLDEFILSCQEVASFFFFTVIDPHSQCNRSEFCALLSPCPAYFTVIPLKDDFRSIFFAYNIFMSVDCPLVDSKPN